MGALFGCYSDKKFDAASESESIVSNLYHKDFCYEALPNLILLKTVWHTKGKKAQVTRFKNLSIISTSHITNRSELCNELKVDLDIIEEELLLSAYLKWGTRCCCHIQGQWIFAVYDRIKQELFIARDPSNQTRLYYYQGNKTVVFSTSIKALLTSSFVSRKFNHHAVYTPGGIPVDDETLYEGVYHITSATTIVIDKEKVCKKEKYWSLDDIQPIRYNTTQDYIDAFTEVYTKAVQDSLIPDQKNAVTLSSGLDSNSIVAIAAPFLKERDLPLHAYTFLPEYDGSKSIPSSRYADESQLIKEAYASDTTVNNHFIKGSHLSLIESLKLNIDICREPFSGANTDNCLGLVLQMGRHDIGNLLIGQYGNFTVSYTGDLPQYLNHLLLKGAIIDYIRGLRTSIRFQNNRHLASVLKQQIKGLFPARIERNRRFNTLQSYSFLKKGVINRQTLLSKKKHNSSSCMQLLSHDRHWNQHIRNKNSWVEWGASAGIRVHDPTADKRVIEFCIGVPQSLFTMGGQKKFLYKQAMKDLVYSKIVHNRKRGLQACDVIQKIRAEKNEVRGALNSIKASPLCKAYLDIKIMENVWKKIFKDESPELFMKAHMTLLHGIHYGLFLKQFEESFES